VNDDCFNQFAKLQDKSVDLYLGDIPYGGECSGFIEGGLRAVNRDLADKEPDGSDFDHIHFINEVLRVCSGGFLVFCGYKQLGEMRAIVDAHDDWSMVRLIVWEKPNVSPMNGQHFFLNSNEFAICARRKGYDYWGGHCEHCTFTHPTEPLPWHPSAKPIVLLKKFIQLMCKENGIVIDFTAGSFSTAVAANEMGRSFICCEKSEKFYKDAMNYYGNRLRTQVLF
jgi:DNA modification methylase